MKPIVRVLLNTDGDAFLEDPRAEVARLLDTMTTAILAGQTRGSFIDRNGNSCGMWRFTFP